MTVIDCPALHFQSEDYPKRFSRKVPKRVRMETTVFPDFPICLLENYRGMVAKRGEEYPCCTNSHGAVSAVLPDGRELGLKPDEFIVIEWYGVER